MKPRSCRISVDLPRDLHHRLREAAACKGCSAKQLILAGIERALEEAGTARPKRRVSLDRPLVPPRGRKPFDLTDEHLYNLIEFP